MSPDDATAVSPSFWAFVVELTELRSDAIELKLRRLLAIVCGALAGSLFQVNCRLSTVNYLTGFYSLHLAERVLLSHYMFYSLYMPESVLLSY